MLTVEKIEKILLDHFDPLRTDGFSVLGQHAAKAAQAIYEAQMPPPIERTEDSPEAWKPTSWDWEVTPDGTKILRRETSIQQKRNGQVQREILRNHHGEPISVALCFVPGEGCGQGGNRT